MWAVVRGLLAALVVGVLMATTEGKATCNGLATGVSCEDRPDKCEGWRNNQFMKKQSPFTEPYMIRKYRKCLANKRSRCCWSQIGSSSTSFFSPSGRRALQSGKSEVGRVLCADPIQDESTGAWSDFSIRIEGGLPRDITGLPSGQTFNISVFGDAWVPSACVFYITDLRRRLGLFVEEDAALQEPALPTYGVVNLENPSVGECNLKPAGDCSCSSYEEDSNCPDRCLELEREFDGHLSLEACAARCNGYTWCAGIEYKPDDTNLANRCWLILRPFTKASTNSSAPESAQWASFQVGNALPVPPPSVRSKAKSDVRCYGRNDETALNSKVDEVKTDGRHGACVLTADAEVQQVCGPYVPGLGLCGPSVCSAYCTQNAACVGFMTHDNKGREECHLIFDNQTPTLVSDVDKYHCFAVDRSVSAEESDWFQVYRDSGFRDLVDKDGNGFDVFHPEVLIDPGLLTEAPTNMPTKMPTEIPEDETKAPTASPTASPTYATLDPTMTPTEAPVEETPDPTVSPTEAPIVPTVSPTEAPVEETLDPTMSPTEAPVEETPDPTVSPTEAPVEETPDPTMSPTEAPVEETPGPTVSPTEAPIVPTVSPTEAPVEETPDPTVSPTEAPIVPTVSPTEAPVEETPDPTVSPTEAPVEETLDPTMSPTEAPFDPTISPTEAPIDETLKPTLSPTNAPTDETLEPTMSPTSAPVDETMSPTEFPTIAPTVGPTETPFTPGELTRAPTSKPRKCTLSQKKKECCTATQDVNYFNRRCCSGDKTTDTGRECCTFNTKTQQMVKCCYKAAGVDKYCTNNKLPLFVEVPASIAKAYNESDSDDWYSYPDEWDSY